MLHFFKQIRQRLASNGNIKKYALYALGELILITLGLFIAMQLNNINDNKKARIFEVKMLKEVQKTLHADHSVFEMLIERASTADSLLNQLIVAYGSEGKFPDSLMNATYGMMMGVAFSYNSGAYEAIKSTGIDRISNDSLRNVLVNLYDFHLPRTTTLLDFAKDAYQAKSMDLYETFFETYVRTLQDGSRRPGVRFRNENLLQDPEFLKLVIYRKQISRNSLRRLGDLMVDVEEAQALLTTELGSMTP